MPVIANKPYKFEAADKEKNFHGARLIYVGWDGQLMFASPYVWGLPPDMPFSVFVQGPVSGAFSQHPNWSDIDWTKASWTKNGEKFVPDFDKNLADNGLIHKNSLRFCTPDIAPNNMCVEAAQ